MDARPPYFLILNETEKMTTCHLRGTNEFLRYRTFFIKAPKMQILNKSYRTYTVCIF